MDADSKPKTAVEKKAFYLLGRLHVKSIPAILQISQKGFSALLTFVKNDTGFTVRVAPRDGEFAVPVVTYVIVPRPKLKKREVFVTEDKGMACVFEIFGENNGNSAGESR